jgi:hypothetical protein
VDGNDVVNVVIYTTLHNQLQLSLVPLPAMVSRHVWGIRRHPRRGGYIAARSIFHDSLVFVPGPTLCPEEIFQWHKGELYTCSVYTPS